MTKQSEKTLQKLENRAKFLRGCRMPSITHIHALLEELEIEHNFTQTQNICETRTKGCRYVNSRWDGKEGYKITVIGTGIELDTSTSYYSVNAPFYAKELVELIKKKVGG